MNKNFWNISLSEIKKGYSFKGDSYVCHFCGKSFKKGLIYKSEQNGLETYMDAHLKVKNHLREEHSSPLHYLLSLDKHYTGLTELQVDLIKLFYQGKSDKDISQLMGGVSPSTIRNHRFKLKEREKEAKAFLAIMEILKEKENEQDADFIDIHGNATMVDERYATKEKEKDKMLKSYFNKKGELLSFPSKENKKIVILQEISQKFEEGKRYSEIEVNNILKRIYPEDIAIIRRYLIEYGFLKREKDCSFYWK